MRLSDAISPTRDMKVAFQGGAELLVTYRPPSYTVNEMEKLQALRESKDVGRIVESVKRVLVAWDLTDDDGNPIPIETEALRDVPTNIFLEIFKGIADDVDATVSAEGKDSDAG